MMKSNNIDEKIKHNYCFEKRQTIWHVLKIADKIDYQISIYKSTKQCCSMRW